MKIVRMDEGHAARLVGIRCDRCAREIRAYSGGNSAEFALQERLDVDFVAGYGAKAFEDGTRYSCELCENCVKELLGPYLRIGDTFEERMRHSTAQPQLGPDISGGRVIWSLLDLPAELNSDE